MPGTTFDVQKATIVLSDEGGMGIELYHGDKETGLSNSIWFW
jgi:hypothetical protein